MSRCIALFLGLVVILTSAAAMADTIPTSVRAQEAIIRLRPMLEKSLETSGFQWGAPIYLRIFKAEKCLEVWLLDGRRFRLWRAFDICTYGGRGLGPKICVGDGRAPEGFYFVAPRQLTPYSRFHLAFNLGYPNAYDRYHGHSGSALMVHGACVSIGCFAMTDERMEVIYALVDAAFRKGQPFFRVHIFPFRMTDRSLAGYNKAEPINFWKNLKQGYDYFERHRQPPDVTVEKGRYVFNAGH